MVVEGLLNARPAKLMVPGASAPPPALRMATPWTHSDKTSLNRGGTVRLSGLTFSSYLKIISFQDRREQ